MAKSISLSLPYLFGAPARELARLGLIRMSIIEHLDVSQNMISIDTSRYDIEIPDDILVVWMDTTFSMKYKVMCLVSRERVIFRVVNEEDAASALDMLRMVVMGGHSGKIVLLTDGGNAFYSAVRQLPPDEQKRIIHVRQFHERGIRGIVAVNYWDGDEPYSLLVPWSIFSNQSRKELERLLGIALFHGHIGNLSTALRMAEIFNILDICKYITTNRGIKSRAGEEDRRGIRQG